MEERYREELKCGEAWFCFELNLGKCVGRVSNEVLLNGEGRKDKIEEGEEEEEMVRLGVLWVRSRDCTRWW